MYKIRFSFILTILALFILVIPACSDDDGPSSADGGVPIVDGGGGLDAAAERDAATGADASVGQDAAPSDSGVSENAFRIAVIAGPRLQGVDTLGPDSSEEFRNRFRNEGLNVVDIAEAVVGIHHLSKDPFFFQFDKAVDGKDGVDILHGQARIIVAVGDVKIFRVDVFGDFPEGRVSVDPLEGVSRLAVFEVKTAGGD